MEPVKGICKHNVDKVVVFSLKEHVLNTGLGPFAGVLENLSRAGDACRIHFHLCW